MRLTHLLLLIVSITTLNTGCYSNATAQSKGQLISDCMSAGGTPEECDRQYSR